MIAPPSGWEAHHWGHDLVLEWQARQVGIAAAFVCLALLVLGRALLPVADRGRVRLAIFFVLAYLALLLVKAGLLNAGMEAAYSTAHLGALIALAWGITATAGFMLFDLAGRRLHIPKILRDLSVTIASAVAMVMILSRSGVNLLSIITTSAVLTAVIGLALQDTLGNLLSGVAMQLESSIAIGDWIRLDERPIGRVLEIRWRSTVIRTKNDDIVIIPNGLFAKGVITVFNKEGLENRRWVYFNVHLRHAPNTVQKIVRDALKGTPNVSMTTPPDCITWRYRRELARVRRALSARRLPARRLDRLRGAQAHLVRAAPREHRDAVSGLQRVHDRDVGGARRDQGRSRARPAARAAAERRHPGAARRRRAHGGRRRPAPYGLRRRRGDHARRRAGRLALHHPQRRRVGAARRRRPREGSRRSSAKATSSERCRS